MDTNVNTICRSQMYFKIGVLKNFAIFTGKHLFCSLYLCEILRNTFFTEQLYWLLLISTESKDKDLKGLNIPSLFKIYS